MGAQCAPLREKKFSAVPIFRSGRRSLVCVRLTSKGSGIQKGGNLGVHPFAHRRGYGAFLRFATDAAVFFSPALCYN